MAVEDEGPRLVVLWEDKLAKGGTPNNYGPHGLLVACVADELARRGPERDEIWWIVSRRLMSLIDPHPCGRDGTGTRPERVLILQRA